VLALYLGNDTDVGTLLHLRSGTGVVFATEVTTDGFGPKGALRGAQVGVETGGILVAAPALSDGAYLTPLAQAASLAPTGRVGIAVAHRDRELAMEGPVATVLRLPLTSYDGVAGEDLEVQLPERWWRTYPHVVSQLLDANGAVVWTDRPETLEAWIGQLSDPPHPRELRIPGDVLQPGPYVLASCFLQQMDLEVAFDGPINEPFSGLWAGTAWLVPVAVLP